MRRMVIALAAVLVAMLGAVPVGAASGSWPTYHGDNTRRGVDPEGGLLPASQAWTSPTLDGLMYAQPIFVAGRIVVATENDSLYGLDPHNGAILWRTNVGTPVPLSTLPCGNIDPLGITGTPAADPATGTVYAVAEMTGPKHQLVAIDALTGAVKFRRDVDPANMVPSDQQQRAALAVANGYVYIAFGGLAGDCGNYHGWVVAVQTDGNGPLLDYQVPTAREGAIWAPSGPAVDAAGNIYVSTGNGSSTTTFDHGESVIKLDPTLHELDYYADSAWASENSSDADLGSTGPLLVDGNLVFQIGKQRTGYLLRKDALGGIGGQAFGLSVCSSFGGGAYAAPFIYAACEDGVRALRLDTAAPSFSIAWHGPSNANGPPIVAGGAVWVMSTTAATLYALDPNDGHILFQSSVGSARRFTSPTAVDGLVLVAADRKVVAFAGPAGPPPPPGTQGYWAIARDGGVFSFGTAVFHGSTGGIQLAAPIVGAAASPTGNGYWLVASDGGIFAFGDARFFGSTGGLTLNRPIVGMASTPTGNGYWLVASDGGIFAFGDARFFGSTGSLALNRPIVGMASTPTGNGYWLVASDGGIFAFGDALFSGSTGSITLNSPIVAMTAAQGGGYLMVAADGGVFAFGGAAFRGSMGGVHLIAPVVAIANTPSGLGYWMAAADGGVFTFGDAQFAGSTGGSTSTQPVVALIPA